jgi:hypothetical protein
VSAVHHRDQVLDVDLAGEPELLRSGARPAGGRLAPAGVVVLRAARDLLLVVELLVSRQADLADRQHAR